MGRPRRKGVLGLEIPKLGFPAVRESRRLPGKCPASGAAPQTRSPPMTLRSLRRHDIRGTGSDRQRANRGSAPPRPHRRLRPPRVSRKTRFGLRAGPALPPSGDSPRPRYGATRRHFGVPLQSAVAPPLPLRESRRIDRTREHRIPLPSRSSRPRPSPSEPGRAQDGAVSGGDDRGAQG